MATAAAENLVPNEISLSQIDLGREQGRTARDGAAAGIVPALVGADATTTGTEPIAPAETQGTPSPANGTSAHAEVPAESQSVAVQLTIVPLPAIEALTFLGVKPDIKDMTLDEKFACLRQCLSYGYGIRKVLCEVFESIRAEFKTYKKDRAGMPTVEEAFKLRGLDYKTVYSQIQREKERRFEDAQFFAAIKAEASSKNFHGLDITDDELPPVGTKVILGDGTKGQILAISEKVAPDAEPSFEIVTEEGTAVQVKRGDLITLAEKQAVKAAAKAAKENDPETETKKTEPIAAAAAQEDDAAKSDAFYAAQYFNLIAILNGAPKEFTAAEFAQTVTQQLQAAYEALGEDAKRVKPGPRLFPAMAQGDENKLFKFLSSDVIGRKSPIRAVFGEIEKGSFRNKVEKFAQRICDKLYGGEFSVTVEDKKEAESRAAQTKKLGDKTNAAMKKAAKTELVKVVRIGRAQEFGLYPELCLQYSAANALTIGTLQMCEAERDRINAKRTPVQMEDGAKAQQE